MNLTTKLNEGLTNKYQTGRTAMQILLFDCYTQSAASITINNNGLAAPKRLNRVTAYRSVIWWVKSDKMRKHPLAFKMQSYC